MIVFKYIPFICICSKLRFQKKRFEMHFKYFFTDVFVPLLK